MTQRKIVNFIKCNLYILVIREPTKVINLLYGNNIDLFPNYYKQ